MTASFDFHIVTGKTARRVVDGGHGRCVEIVRDAYLAHAAGHAHNPGSVFLRYPERPRDRIIALLASMGGDHGCSGIKWIASWPDNARRGFPRASAVLVLNRNDTGYPFACLESSVISAARTAASAELGARAIVGAPRARCLAVIGTGLIARYVYEFLAGTGWAIEEVVLHDVAPGEAERFAAEVVRPGAHRTVRIAPSAEHAIRWADLIVFATVAATPHVADPAWFAHAPVVLHLSLRDLATEVILDAWNVADDVDHCLTAGTSLHLAEQQTGGRDFVAGGIADLLAGRIVPDRERARIFSPFGMGVLDLAVGQWIYQEAIASGEAVAVPDFFWDLAR